MKYGTFDYRITFPIEDDSLTLRDLHKEAETKWLRYTQARGYRPIRLPATTHSHTKRQVVATGQVLIPGGHTKIDPPILKETA